MIDRISSHIEFKEPGLVTVGEIHRGLHAFTEHFGKAPTRIELPRFIVSILLRNLSTVVSLSDIEKQLGVQVVIDRRINDNEGYIASEWTYDSERW